MALGARPLALAALFGYQVLCGAQSPGVYAIAQILAGPGAAGRWVGIQNSCGSLAGVIAPALTGFILGSGPIPLFATAFLVAAGFSLLGLIGWIAMLPRLGALDWTVRT
jgi:hypothetical protein